MADLNLKRSTFLIYPVMPNHFTRVQMLATVHKLMYIPHYSQPPADDNAGDLIGGTDDIGAPTMNGFDDVRWILNFLNWTFQFHICEENLTMANLYFFWISKDDDPLPGQLIINTVPEIEPECIRCVLWYTN